MFTHNITLITFFLVFIDIYNSRFILFYIYISVFQFIIKTFYIKNPLKTLTYLFFYIKSASTGKFTNAPWFIFGHQGDNTNFISRRFKKGAVNLR